MVVEFGFNKIGSDDELVYLCRDRASVGNALELFIEVRNLDALLHDETDPSYEPSEEDSVDGEWSDCVVGLEMMGRTKG